MVEAAGIEPSSQVCSEATEPAQNCAKSKQINALPDSAASASEQNRALSTQDPDRSAHPKRVPSVHQLPPDLARIAEAWDSLPEAVKAGILAMVDAARQE